MPTTTTTLTPLLRRLTRVRARGRDDLYVDEAFDDVFVLWRAFEGTFSGDGREGEQAEAAVVETLDHAHAYGPLDRVAPALLRWCEILKLFQRVGPATLAPWFNRSSLTTKEAQALLRRLAALTSAADVPARWHTADSRNLAWALYSLRCAVFHAAVETQDQLAARVTPLFRDALVELNVLRSAALAGVSVADAWAQADAQLSGWVRDGEA